MSAFFLNQTRQLLALGALSFLVGAVLFLAATPARSQSTSEALSGYGWSETIGWISLSGTGYAVVRQSTGFLTGYAWSENIGWISANASDTASCGTQARIVDDVASGWLRALSGGTAQSGGWDGCISVSGSGYGVTMTPNPSYSANYAWGSNVIGWISFNIAPLAPPPPPPSFADPTLPLSISLTADPGRVRKGGTSTINWSSENAESCTVTGPGGPWTGLSGSRTTPAIDAQTVYALECSNAGGSASRLITVTVVPSVQEI